MPKIVLALISIVASTAHAAAVTIDFDEFEFGGTPSPLYSQGYSSPQLEALGPLQMRKGRR